MRSHDHRPRGETEARVRVTSHRSETKAIRAVEALKTAKDCIGAITPGMALFAITRGQFSTADIIRHCLDEMGPSKISVWTWCTAGYDIETFEWFFESGRITSASLVIDDYGEKRARDSERDESSRRERQGVIMRRWIATFGPGSIRVCKNHAKVVTLDNGTLKVVIRGSANLNKNPRFENFDLSEGPGLYNFMQEMEASIPLLGQNYTQEDARAASALKRLFTDAELLQFPEGELRAWQK